jgi:hypothetical protein
MQAVAKYTRGIPYDEAEELRRKWRLKQSPHCGHPVVAAERTETDVFTGHYVCTTCGSGGLHGAGPLSSGA